MVRIESVQRGVRGIVRLAAEGGSLFRFREPYLEAALAEDSLEYGDTAAGEVPDRFEAGGMLPESALAAACEASQAEEKAVALLARAEQTRAGLERKLGAKKLPALAIRRALDFLESEGLLSDYRYAMAWSRQRMRRRAEGPTSLATALAFRGVARDAARQAVGDRCSGEAGREALESALRLTMHDTCGDIVEARRRLRSLGWKSGDIDDAIDSLMADNPG
ncbi:MAG: regulatory protein RecX [Spirochaetales bacterium]|nr:MAG: regulatory protein RecX [Spirochaetales bacterium]